MLHLGVDTSNLTDKRDFVGLKPEVHKLEINKLVKVRTVLKNFKTKADGLDVDKLKIAPLDLKKLSDVVSIEIAGKNRVQQAKYKSKLRKQNPDASALIQTNQYNTDKQRLEKKLKILIKKTNVGTLVTAT